MELFKNFKNNYLELKSSIKLWEVSTDIEIYNCKKSGWVNMQTTQLDGNPIIFYFNQEEKKGIRVIQIDPEVNNTNDLSYWIDRFGDDKSLNGTELVFSGVLSELNLLKYREILSKWLNNERINVEKK